MQVLQKRWDCLCAGVDLLLQQNGLTELTRNVQELASKMLTSARLTYSGECLRTSTPTRSPALAG